MQRLSFRSLGIFLVAGALVVPAQRAARAQGVAAGALPRLAAVQGDTIRVGTGERVTLPFTAVSRIIVEDDEVARAYFQNGSAVLEGVGRGTTTVEVYQSDGTPKLLSIQVGAAGSTAPANPVAPIPAIPLATPPLTVAPTPLTNLPTTQPASAAITPEIPNVMAPDTTPTAAITPATSQLSVSLGAVAVPGAGQAQFTINYANPGQSDAPGAIVRYALDERVSYVTGSASDGGTYDAARREVMWKLGPIPAGTTGKLTLRVEPIEGARTLSFNSVATIEDGQNGPVTSANLNYSTAVTPLLTVFALPDRFLANQNSAIMTDVRGNEYQTAVDRLSQIGIVQGYPDGLFHPVNSTARAEYAVMTLRGLNLRDLRDVTQIKFVLGRASTVNLSIADAEGRTVAKLTTNINLEAGEHTVVWNGRTDSGAFAQPGRYTYTCEARDARGETTALQSVLTIVSPTPLKAEGMPSFVDIKATDWYAGYLAVGENQGLLLGFPDKTFRPKQAISRVEATAIVVRALGLADVAKEWADKNVGFEDYDKIPAWARGPVNVATTLAKTGNGKPIFRGTEANKFEPLQDLRRDQAALIVQRLIDRETTRRVSVSGALAPGAIVSINSKPIEADGQGRFGFSFDLNTALPTTVAVVDTRNR